MRRRTGVSCEYEALRQQSHGRDVRTREKNGGMSLEHRPPDLNDLSEDEQVREVYAWAGLALYQAQVVEYAIINVRVIARQVDPEQWMDPGSVDQFVESGFRQMMGRLAQALQQDVDLPQDLVDRLTEALRLRNFLVHSFFRERVELFCTQHGRKLMLDELAKIAESLSAADDELEQLLVQVGAPAGLTLEEIAAKAAELQGAVRRAAGEL